MTITWRTSKIEDGFKFQVYAFDYQVPTQELKIGVCTSRAKAVLQAKKWTRYFKAPQRAA